MILIIKRQQAWVLLVYVMEILARLPTRCPMVASHAPTTIRAQSVMCLAQCHNKLAPGVRCLTFRMHTSMAATWCPAVFNMERQHCIHSNWPPRMHRRVHNFRSQRTTVATDQLAMIHWANRKTTVRARTKAVADNNRKDKMCRIHHQVAPDPISHRPCTVTRATLLWTKSM